VEPLWDKELETNKNLNCLDNITVLKFGIGIFGSENIKFGDHEETVMTVEMGALVGSLPNINVAKIDCEGAEWSFLPSVLTGIREIHMEYHVRKSNRESDWNLYRIWGWWFEKNGYEVEKIADNRKLGWNCPFEANIGVRAVKK